MTLKKGGDDVKRYRFPRGSAALRTLFEAGHIPECADFAGSWTVRMLTGPVPDFSWIGHCKDFPPYRDGSAFFGNNRALGFVRFGWFRVLESSPESPFITLDYANGERRNLVFGAMRDRLRVVESGVMIGGYYFQKAGALRFAGWFALERKPARKASSPTAR